MKILIGITVIIIVTISLYAIVQAKLLHKTTQSKSKYPKLGDDIIYSTNYELKKVAKLGVNNITDQVRFLESNQTFIFNAGLCSYLRFDANGKLLSSFSNSSPMHQCGVCFHNDCYIDWALTGSKEKKLYSAQINGEILTKQEFESYYHEAEVVVYDNFFTYDPDTSTGKVYMKIKGEWLVIKSDFPEIDRAGEYFENARQHIMHGYPIKNEIPFVGIENTIVPFYDWDNKDNPIYIEDHLRRIRIKRGWLQFDVNNNIRPNGWESTGYFHFNMDEDTLRFQAYAFEKTENITGFNPYMSLYKTDALPHIVFLLVEEGRGDRLDWETGFYVIRKMN